MSRVAETLLPRRLGRTFRWLASSSWSGNLGDGISLAAGPLLVASLTRDPVKVALAAGLQRLPWLLFGLVAGVVADRVDRRRIMMTVHLARATVAGSLVVAIATDRVSITFVLVALFCLGLCEVVADTTASTLLPLIVEREDLGVANARLMAGIVTVGQLAGPPIGAALFAVGRLVPFIAEATCMLTASVLASRLHLRPIERSETSTGRVAHEIAEGFRWLWRHAAVRTLAITIVTFNITFGAAWSVLVLYAIERLHTGKVGFGLLTSAAAAGGLLGAGIYARLTARVSLGNVMRGGLVIETLTHLSLAVTRSVAVALVIMFIFGAHAQVWGVTSTTVRQLAVPDRLQGRVGSVYLIGVQGGIVVGTAIGGAIAERFGVTGPFWFAFAGSALFVALIWRQLPQIARPAET